ncbi:hypothetical protein [Phenylobacterium sp.]|uniref:hypothetical protein n=1 Tax=Phenylobacterium sp. TaxID=1871053 RepID=UPI002E2F5CFA|nr:hypothetical protein [Phenylobacterium sp.]HEX2561053.1 hypothetical protein [Phenylobacterium sp.]
MSGAPRDLLTIAAAGLCLAGAPAAAAQVRTPAPGSPERKLLLDQLRPKVEAAIGRPVIFKVERLRVAPGWAFAIVEPRHPDGSPITEAQTRVARENPDLELDGLRTEALWRETGGRWRLHEHAIGATDVWYEPYCAEAPKGLIPVCPAP